MPSRGHETVLKTAVPNAPSTMAELPIDLDRARRTPLAAQIYAAIREAIETGSSPPARGCLPGAIWRLSSASPAAPCAWPTNV